MIYLLVDLKIVLALHPSDPNWGWSERVAYPRAGRLSKFEVLWEGGGGGGGALNRAGALTRVGAPNRGNTVFVIGNIQSFTFKFLGGVSPLEENFHLLVLWIWKSWNSDHQTAKIKLYSVRALYRCLNEKELMQGRITATISKVSA